MGKVIQILGRTVKRSLNKKALIYVIFILVSSLIIFYLNQSFPYDMNRTDLRVWEAVYAGDFLSLGILWIVGLPFLIYLSFLLSKSISDEINSGTALLVLTRPVKRKEFVLSKFLGLVVFLNIINAIILFVFPALANFMGVPAIFLPTLFKTSLALLLYSLVLSLALAAIGIFLSANLRKSTISLSSLFILIFVSFFFPLLSNLVTTLPKIPIVKPFYSVMGFFNIPLLPGSVSIVNVFTNSYYTTSKAIIGNFSPLLVIILSCILVPIILIWITRRLFSRQDIT